MIESLLLTAARISTFDEQRLLTNASGFFFERDARLFVVTSRHARIDEPLDRVAVGTSLLVVGFPLGFHDTCWPAAIDSKRSRRW